MTGVDVQIGVDIGPGVDVHPEVSHVSTAPKVSSPCETEIDIGDCESSNVGSSPCRDASRYPSPTSELSSLSEYVGPSVMQAI